MFSMTSLRNNQKGIIWVFLVFFILTLFGVGGSILGTISIFDPLMNALGIETSIDPNRAVGSLNGSDVSTAQYELFYDHYEQQGYPHIRSWAQFKRDRLINSTVDDMELNPVNSRSWRIDFATNTPTDLQSALIENSLYMNPDSSFNQSKFRSDFLGISGSTLDPFSIEIINNNVFQNQSQHKQSVLRGIFNNLASVNNHEIEEILLKGRVNCTIEAVGINLESVVDHKPVTETQIKNRYDRDKESLYKKSPERKLEYSFFDFPEVSDSIPNPLRYTYSKRVDSFINGKSDGIVADTSGSLTLSMSIETPIPSILTDYSYERSLENSIVRKIFDTISINDMDTLSTEKGIGIFKVIYADDSDYIDIDSVSTSIKDAIEIENKIDWAKLYLKDRVSSIDISSGLEGAVDELITYNDPDSSKTRDIKIGNLRYTQQSSELVGMILSLEAGDITDPVSIQSFGGKERFVKIFKVLEKDILTDETMDKDFSSERKSLINQKSSKMFDNWYNAMLNSMSEQDIRDEIY